MTTQPTSLQPDEQGAVIREESFRIGEWAFCLGSPEILLMLAEYHDFQQDHADIVEAGCHGDRDRALWLRQRAAKIVAEDPDCFDPAIVHQVQRYMPKVHK